jgi:hypothetical protein
MQRPETAINTILEHLSLAERAFERDRFMIVLSYITWLEGFRQGVLAVREDPGIVVFEPELTDDDFLDTIELLERGNAPST